MRHASLVLAVSAFLLAGCGGGESDESAGSAGTPLRTIKISEKEFSLGPASVTVDKAGTYAFAVSNDGSVTHALEIEGNGVEAETDEIDPGGTATLRVKLDKEGSYELYCPIGNHRKQGMEGEVKVGSGSMMGEPGGTSTNTTTTKSGYGY